jgi:hypothetical protein
MDNLTGKPKNSKQVKKTTTDKLRRRKREKKKPFGEFEQSRPVQLSLFELGSEDKDYSQSVELYDFIPKYSWGKVKRIEGEFLRTINREFKCNGTRYLLTLMPARIETGKGTSMEYYPALREELVEDALRKMMTERQGVLLDGEAGITFTLYQLQKELSEKGHTYSYGELKDAIRILNGTDIILKDENEKVETSFSPIEHYGFAGEGGETKTFVKFSPLVTTSIKSGTFRLLNYDKAMSYTSVIARQLHKRMSHNYLQASMTNPYDILLTTMVRDFGLTLQRRIQYNLDEVEKAIDEMKRRDVILNCKIDKIYELKPRRKLINAKLFIQPHPNFISDIIKANKNAKKVRALQS